MKYLLFFISFFVVLGCGGGSSKQTEATAMALLGNLANAKVEIYEMQGDGTFILKWVEQTSNATALKDIGKFPSHAHSLDPNKFYLYKVSGGEDWDKNDDGIKDSNYTLFTGTIRAFALGADIQKAANSFKVTMLSEIVFQKIQHLLDQNITIKKLETEIEQYTQSEINKTLNEVLSFDPKKDMDTLSNNLKEMIKISLYDKYMQELLGKVTLDKTITTIDAQEKIFTSAYLQRAYHNYIFLATEDGIKIYDITDISKAKYIKTLPISEAYSMKIKNDYLYIAAGSKFVIANISNIQKAAIVSKIYVEDIKEFFLDLALSKDTSRAYIANFFAGLLVVDISNKKSPKVINRFDTNGVTTTVRLSSDGSKAYIANYGFGLKVLDISDEQSINIIGSYKEQSINSFEVNGNKAFIASFQDGLKVIDLDTLSLIRKVDSVHKKGYAIEYETNYVTGYTTLFYANSSGITKVEFDPSYVPTVGVTYKSNCLASSLYEYETNRLFVANKGTSNCKQRGLQIIDIK